MSSGHPNKTNQLKDLFQSSVELEIDEIRTKHKIICPKCHNQTSARKNCFSCLGEGFIDSKFKSCFFCSGKGFNSDKTNCNICQGYGFISKNWFPCQTCQGKQKIEKKKCHSCSGGGNFNLILKSSKDMLKRYKVYLI